MTGGLDKMQGKRALLLAMSLLASCAPIASQQPRPSGTAPAVGDASSPVEVSMHVEALAQKEQRQYVLRQADTLHGGDGVALYVKVDRPAYAYVAIANLHGAKAMLVPTGDQGMMAPGVEQRIPGPGQWLYLDEQVGLEHLYVVASTRPLQDTDGALCTQLQLPCAEAASTKKPPAPAAPSPPSPPPPPPPPPGNLDIKTRGRHRKLGAILQAQTDEGGVAVLHFSFHHER